MTREQLEHAIRAACEVSEDSEIWIFGSQPRSCSAPSCYITFASSYKNKRASTKVKILMATGIRQNGRPLILTGC